MPPDGRGRPTAEVQLARVLELHGRGLALAEVAHELGVSPRTVQRRTQDLRLWWPRGSLVSGRRSVPHAMRCSRCEQLVARVALRHHVRSITCRRHEPEQLTIDRLLEA